MVPEESTHAMASVGRMTFTIKKQVSYRSDGGCDGDGGGGYDVGGSRLL